MMTTTTSITTQPTKTTAAKMDFTLFGKSPDDFVGDMTSLFGPGGPHLVHVEPGVYDATTSFDASLLSSPLSPDLLSPFPLSEAISFLSTPSLSPASPFDGMMGSYEEMGGDDEFPSLFGNSFIPQHSTWSPPDIPIHLPPTTLSEENVSPLLLSLPSPVITSTREIAPLPTSTSTSTSTSMKKAKEGGGAKLTGIRNTTKPAIDFTAPTLPKTYIIPASTSRKRAPPAVTTKLVASKKKAKVEIPVGDEGLDPAELPEELLEAIESKRRQNTLAARKSRMRKTAFIEGLKEEISTLEGERDEWKSKCDELEKIVRALRGE